MQTLNLNGYALPILGLGTWKSAPGEVYTAVKEAIKIGYRHIDCAAIYGNEKEVGNAIKTCIEEGTVTRDELWVTSKLWNNMHGENNVAPAIQKTLSDLQLEYLDLYLIHWPVAQKKLFVGASKAQHFLSLEEQPIANTWKGMEKAVELGLTKTIGVSNFSVKKLKELIANSSIKPVLNQVELHPYFQQDELVDYCHTNNIHVMAYSPLGSSDRPEGLKAEDEPVLLEDKSIAALASKINASVAQTIIAWDIHRGISVIPKSVNPARLKQNFEAVEIKLSDTDMANIKKVNKDRRYVDGKFWVVPDGPYTIENLWDE
ncbi:aldo/keto reductase [Carboxylicivirga sp. A043]|uniref:aldo/keto reductase n=1 Tax=Carboxylicivirga litoralis TaxID=2816963 RepID=UPI0021CAEE71|nr:aldo/keto reductase [Carboxylicivirga sp. A043]MCU4154353.1 aldo/keto reductase [Carboxylicivirga sp. A043]